MWNKTDERGEKNEKERRKRKYFGDKERNEKVESKRGQ